MFEASDFSCKNTLYSFYFVYIFFLGWTPYQTAVVQLTMYMYDMDIFIIVTAFFLSQRFSAANPLWFCLIVQDHQYALWTFLDLLQSCFLWSFHLILSYIHHRKHVLRLHGSSIQTCHWSPWGFHSLICISYLDLFVVALYL